jgi:ribosomal protein L25 (general stress protein Ctc)
MSVASSFQVTDVKVSTREMTWLSNNVMHMDLGHAVLILLFA